MTDSNYNATITADNRNFFQRAQDSTRTWMHDRNQKIKNNKEYVNKLKSDQLASKRATAVAFDKWYDQYKADNPLPIDQYPAITVDGNSLRYPSSPAIDVDSDYVVFKFYKYQPPWGRSFANQADGMGMGAEGMTEVGLHETTGPYKKGNQKTAKKAWDNAVGERKNQLNVYNRADQYTETIDPTIMLYMPDDISTGYKANWGGKSVGAAGRARLVAAGAEGQWKKVMKEYAGKGQQFDRWASNIGMNWVKSAVKGASGDVLSDSDIFGGIGGVVENPNAELLFQNTDMRTFSLKYRLVPRNQDEAGNIRAIINLFKRNMLPGTQVSQVFQWSRGDGVTAGFISVPDLVRVSFMKGGAQNRALPQFKMCALSQVDVNYTPDGSYSTYDDGNMVATELTLNFQETKLIYKEEADLY